MKIVVIGATGTIGKRVVEKLEPHIRKHKNYSVNLYTVVQIICVILLFYYGHFYSNLSIFEYFLSNR